MCARCWWLIPSVTLFEYTEEMAVFDLLGINLYHGWLIDPAVDQPAVRVGVYARATPMTHHRGWMCRGLGGGA